MDFHDAPPRRLLHASTTPADENEVWCPGSLLYARSPGREQILDCTHMDRLRCKQDMQKLFENIPESSYDLSLKDIVDPSYSISGNLKAIVAEEELTSQVHGQAGGKNRSWKSSSIFKLNFSFSCPGLRGKSRRREHQNLFAWKASPSANEENVFSALNSTLIANSDYPKITPGCNISSMSKIHPSNQCSLCSSFTIFFKSRCLVCGRLYCSNCAREYMDNLASGFKCKVPCKNGSLRKRLSQKMAGRCWPFWSFFEVRRLYQYS